VYGLGSQRQIEFGLRFFFDQEDVSFHSDYQPIGWWSFACTADFPSGVDDHLVGVLAPRLLRSHQQSWNWFCPTRTVRPLARNQTFAIAMFEVRDKA
jgi:hypothetical protein